MPISLTASVIEPLLELARRGAGIGCFPEFLVRDGVADGSLLPILDGEIEQTGVLTMLWPASRFRVPEVRAFVDYVAKHVRTDVGC